MPTNDIARCNIKKYRKLRKMSQKEFAEALDVTHSSVSAWETGKNSIDLTRLNQICQVLDITMKELLFESESKEKPDPPVIELCEETREILEIVKGRPEVRELIWSCQGANFNDVLIATQLLRALKTR